MHAFKIEGVDLKARAGESSVRELVSLAIGYPTPEKIARVIAEYLQRDELRLLGFEIEGELVGYVGFEMIRPDAAHMLHFAVTPARQRSGVGRAMVGWLQQSEGFTYLQAETDEDAADFYRKVGFRVESWIDTRYPDAQRYMCRLEC